MMTLKNENSPADNGEGSGDAPTKETLSISSATGGDSTPRSRPGGLIGRSPKISGEPESCPDGGKDGVVNGDDLKNSLVNKEKTSSTRSLNAEDHDDDPNSESDANDREGDKGDQMKGGSLSMRERFTPGDPLHNPDKISGMIRNRVGKFINANPVQLINTILIILNAMLLGTLTFLYENPDATHYLELLDMSMLIAFTFENGCQLIYYGKMYLNNGWLIFDGLIVAMSWIFQNSSMSVLRSFRIFRVFILVSKFESFRLLIQAVVRTLPKMQTIAAALLMFFYVFCVVFTNLYHTLYIDDGTGEAAPDSPLDYDYFGRLDKTFLTLFQLMTLDSWTGLVRQVTAEKPWSMLGFCIWVIITAFLFINLVVAVICESLIEMSNMREAQKQEELMEQQKQIVSNETDRVMSETQQVLAFQKEMLANQLLMQQTLMEIANSIPKVERRASHRV